uniref:Uncharacterized protein n=1 Tax=Triticum urartu TaxID=4572 RepID=A0A8R7UFJ2_TRIUA
MKVKPIFFCSSLSIVEKLWIVGNGRRTGFWEDVWLGDNPFGIKFPRLHLLTFSANFSVPEVIKSEFATVRFRRNVCVWGGGGGGGT